MKMSEPKRCPYCGELMPDFSPCYCMESDGFDDYPDEDNGEFEQIDDQEDYYFD